MPEKLIQMYYPGDKCVFMQVIWFNKILDLYILYCKLYVPLLAATMAYMFMDNK